MKAPVDIYEYCRAYSGYFYTWQDDNGDSLAVSNGRAACYIDQLKELLELFNDQGAPAFGTLLLTLIATGNDSDRMLTDIEQIFKETVRRSPNADEASEKHELKPAFSFLSKLSSLPQKYRGGKLRKQVLQTIFQSAHNLLSSRRIKQFVETFSGGTLDHEKLASLELMNLGILRRDLRPLGILNSRYPDMESLLLSLADIPMQEEIPLQLEEPVTDSGTPKDFIEVLEAEPETFHIGALVRRIWSGLAIPFHSNLPSVQPLGGVSDLSNKGELDKLLISEHANEEILFLSRLANGEALYINRETPPQTDRLQRIILIDSSLQTWGTPRSLAFALLVAISRHPKTDIDCIAYAVGQRHRPIQCSDLESLIDSLQFLDASADASGGLDSYFNSELTRGKHEIIFISSPEGYRQAPVQRIIYDQIAELGYCMTADEHGAVCVFRKKGRSLTPLQSFSLPLKDLWANPPVSKKPIVPEYDAVLPSSYPILFPLPLDAKAFLTTIDREVFAITKERTVLRRWKSALRLSRKGWAYVLDRLPAGNCQYEIGLTTAGEYLLLCHSIDKREVHLINLSTGARALTHIDTYISKAWAPKFHFQDDGFVVIDSGGWKFHLERSSERHDAPALKVTKLEGDIQFEASKGDQFKYEADQERVSFSGTVLKNLKRAGINASGALVINQHELVFQTADETIRFKGGAGRTSRIFGKSTARNRLEFEDGSHISIERTGMLILKSSSDEIGTIYIPSVLDVALGAATADFYAGNDFFDPMRAPQQRRISPETFYNQFISAFTSQILTFSI